MELGYLKINGVLVMGIEKPHHNVPPPPPIPSGKEIDSEFFDEELTPEKCQAAFLAATKPFVLDEPVRAGHLPGRNDLCPCGSGKKYKKCCLN